MLLYIDKDNNETVGASLMLTLNDERKESSERSVMY